MSLSPGTRLGHYEIVAPIGAGGMGQVYRARDLHLEREVAIKVLPESLASHPVARDRFEREAKSVAALSHPNILTIFDFGAEGEIAYAVTELLRGQDLGSELSRRGPLPVDEVVAIGLELAAGLGAAHRSGIVHRDVKPGNLFRLEDGSIKILDFGLARAEIQPEAETLASDVATATPHTEPGTVLGTVRYMSPEQARGQVAQPPSDVFSAGCVLYEMLAGVAPFARETQTDSLAAILKEEPTSFRELGVSVPAALERVVLRAMSKDPAARFADGRQLGEALRGVAQELSLVGLAPPAAVSPARRWLLSAGVVALAALAVALLLLASRRAQEREARETRLPEIAALAEEGEYLDAWTAAREIEPLIGGEPAFRQLLDAITTTVTVETEPPGATVSWTPYDAPESDATVLGTTPLEARLPTGVLRFAIALDGHHPLDLVRRLVPPAFAESMQRSGLLDPADPGVSFAFRLTPEKELATDLIPVQGGRYNRVPLVAFPVTAAVELADFAIGRFEVTNREYQEFVDAGGYRTPHYWSQLGADGGDAFQAAVAELVDSTGRPGPPGWELGQYPAERGEHPVSGLSWHEADAYCRFRERSLPTVYHWTRAALPSTEIAASLSSAILPSSNIGAEGGGAVGSAPVGSHAAPAATGAWDMAGNVREWTSTGNEQVRYVLGGSWSDPVYLFTQPVRVPVTDRSPGNGVRCVLYREPPAAALLADVTLPSQDLEQLPEIPAATLDATLGFFRAPPGPLNVEADAPESFGEVRHQRVVIDAAYRGERLPLHLFTPAGADPDAASPGAASLEEATEPPGPPLQVVVVFPGINALTDPGFRPEGVLPIADWVVRSGRTLVVPIYQGTWERRDGDTLAALMSPNEGIRVTMEWSQDLARTLDYLGSRPDLDGDRVAYWGISLGGVMAPALLAAEPRFGAALLWSSGLSPIAAQEQLALFASLADRVDVPLLLLAGRYDYVIPSSHQRALFERWGAPPEQKRFVEYDSGHFPLPRGETIRESLEWLDRHLGTVRATVIASTATATD